jgi:hypothetical protein
MLGDTDDGVVYLLKGHSDVLCRRIARLTALRGLSAFVQNIKKLKFFSARNFL